MGPPWGGGGRTGWRVEGVGGWSSLGLTLYDVDLVVDLVVELLVTGLRTGLRTGLDLVGVAPPLPLVVGFVGFAAAGRRRTGLVVEESVDDPLESESESLESESESVESESESVDESESESVDESESESESR